MASPVLCNGVAFGALKQVYQQNELLVEYYSELVLEGFQNTQRCVYPHCKNILKLMKYHCIFCWCKCCLSQCRLLAISSSRLSFQS